MLSIQTSDLVEGMILAKDLYLPNGTLMVKSGVALTQKYIKIIEKKEIPIVYIDDPLTDDIVIEDFMPFEMVKELSIYLENQAHHVRKNEPLEEANLKKVMEKLIKSLLGKSSVSFSLANVKIFGEYLINHALSVVCISLAYAIKCKRYNFDDLVELGMGALVQDIGMYKISPEILNKKDKLSDAEFAAIKRHPFIGFILIKKNLGAVVAHYAYQHHEQHNSFGYPRKLTSNGIKDKVKITALADMWDSLLSKRPFRNKMPNSKAYKIFKEEIGKKFDPLLGKEFITLVPPFPAGVTVKLSDGRIGVVKSINNEKVDRPVVKVIYDENRQKLSKVETINLLNDETTEIIDSFM